MIDIEQPIKDEVKKQRLLHYKVEMAKTRLNIIAFEAISDQHNAEIHKIELEKLETIYLAVEAVQ